MLLNKYNWTLTSRTTCIFSFYFVFSRFKTFRREWQLILIVKCRFFVNQVLMPETYSFLLVFIFSRGDHGLESWSLNCTFCALTAELQSLFCIEISNSSPSLIVNPSYSPPFYFWLVLTFFSIYFMNNNADLRDLFKTFLDIFLQIKVGDNLTKVCNILCCIRRYCSLYLTNFIFNLSSHTQHLQWNWLPNITIIVSLKRF